MELYKLSLRKDSGSFDCTGIKNVDGPRVEGVCENIHKTIEAKLSES